MKSSGIVLSLAALTLIIYSCTTVPSEPTMEFEIQEQQVEADASFRGTAVRGKSVAWVSGTNGTILKTNDAGETWSRIRIPNTDTLDFRDIEILNDSTILIMSIGPGQQSNIFKSTDNGLTWKTTLTNPHESAFYNGFDFWDEKTGMLISDPIDSKLLVLLTEDGGDTWVRVGAESLPDKKETEYGFAASGTGIKCLGRTSVWIATGGDEARVFYSPDKGKTWSVHQTGMASGSQGAGIFSIEMKDGKNGICVGGDYLDPEKDKGNVAFTEDGGKTWNLVKNDPPVFHKACVRYLGNDMYLAVGRTGVEWSGNNGRTWEKLSENSYYTFDYDRHSGVGYIAGAEGKIFKLFAEQK